MSHYAHLICTFNDLNISKLNLKLKITQPDKMFGQWKLIVLTLFIYQLFILKMATGQTSELLLYEYWNDQSK
jgi:hypothetical protein